MRFLSKKETKVLVTLSPTHMARLEEQNKFPKRLRLGVGRYSRVAYIESEVLAWMEAKVAERDKGSQATP